MSTKKTAKKTAQTSDEAKAIKQTILAKPTPSGQDPTFRKNLQRRRDEIVGELGELLSPSTLGSVLAKDWLHNPQVHSPSIDLLSYFGNEMLYGEKASKLMLRSSHSDINETLVLLADTISNYDDYTLNKSIEHAVARLQILGWIYGKDRAHWALFHAHLNIRTNDHDHHVGAQYIARHMIESLVLRCIKFNDWKQIDALRLLVKNKSTGECSKRKAIEEIVIHVFIWHHHLEKMLGRLPSREEMKDFLINLEPALSIRKETWTDALRLLSFRYSGPRSIRKDKQQIVKLALTARDTGPTASVKIQANSDEEVRLRSWHKPLI